MPEARAKILVVFYSRDGAVEALAKAITEGAPEKQEQKSGCAVFLT